MEVENQEAKGCSGNSKNKLAGLGSSGKIAGICNRKAADAGDSGSKAVKAVNKIDGIGDSDYPKYCEYNREPLRKYEVATAKEIRNGKDSYAEKARHDGTDNLAKELYLCGKTLKVINYSKQHYHCGADEETYNLALSGSAFSSRNESQNCNEHADKNANAAYSWNRLVVHSASVLWNIHEPELWGYFYCNRRQRRGNNCGKQKRLQTLYNHLF